MNKNFFEYLEGIGIRISQKQKEKISKRLDNIIKYEPKIGIMGKTGAGKSSLCNALFGMDLCKVSDVEACTRKTEEVLVNIGEKGLKLVDIPGVGESEEKNKEYANLYKNLIPELDLILWVIKGDDRALAEDEKFYENIIKPYVVKEEIPFLFVVNQVDKIEPFREWNVEKHEPGNTQYRNISRKIKNIAEIFDVPEFKIIGVSANEKYNLTTLVEQIVYILPKEKKIVVCSKMNEDFVTEKTSKHVNRNFWEVIGDVVTDVTSNACDTITTLGEKIIDTMEDVPIIGRLFSWFF